MQNLYDLMTARQIAHDKADAKAYARLLKRSEDAQRMIGELCRDGRVVHYICPQGGTYREGERGELTAFLIRNKYV